MYELEVRPKGVPKLFELAPLLVLAWLIHAIVFRGQWAMTVTQVHRRGPEIWTYTGYRSKQEVQDAIAVLTERIEAGNWAPK
jgi:hypothetical protein